MILITHLQRYGRLSVDIYKQNGFSFLMDFSGKPTTVESSSLTSDYKGCIATGSRVNDLLTEKLGLLTESAVADR